MSKEKGWVFSKLVKNKSVVVSIWETSRLWWAQRAIYWSRASADKEWRSIHPPLKYLQVSFSLFSFFFSFFLFFSFCSSRFLFFNSYTSYMLLVTNLTNSEVCGVKAEKVLTLGPVLRKNNACQANAYFQTVFSVCTNRNVVWLVRRPIFRARME